MRLDAGRASVLRAGGPVVAGDGGGDGEDVSVAVYRYAGAVVGIFVGELSARGDEGVGGVRGVGESGYE